MSLKYIDIHSHLNLPQFEADLPEVVARMEEDGIGTITVGVDEASSRKALSIAQSFSSVYACVGLHPADNRDESFDPATYKEMVTDKKVVAIGECGLDYYRNDEPEEKKRQAKEFEAQIVFAKEADLPLMLHGRPKKGTMDAYADMIEILKAHRDPSLRGNAHFFVGDIEIARQLLELNFTLSFTGVITFARDYDEVLQYAPIDMIHAETDSPYATPEPFRGKRCEPIHVKEVIAKMADIKKVELETLEMQLRESAEHLFAIS